jgi:Reverse transcriptase (RNA-dependent DNA polymerase)
MTYHPPPVTTFGKRLTKDWWDALDLQGQGFLWEEEVKLVFDVLMKNEAALAWDDSEKGRFREDYFAPTVVPTIEHEPWALKNIPIPHGLQASIIKFIKEKKIASGTYKPSGSSYRSRWFCVPKKNGTVRIVHDLQPLNAITVKDAGVPPNIEPFAEHAAGRAIYTLGDLFTGFDHASVAEESRDLFTFQTPLGPHRLTCLPMGWMNSVAIFQGHVAFILQDEIQVAPPYLDDVPILGPRS